MNLLSKLLVAGVVVSIVTGVAAMLIGGYGDAREQYGRQAASQQQLQAALDIQAAAVIDQAKARQRQAALEAQLAGTREQLNRQKEEAINNNASYRTWRNTPVHLLARCRIWGLCDEAAPGDGAVRPPGR